MVPDQAPDSGHFWRYQATQTPERQPFVCQTAEQIVRHGATDRVPGSTTLVPPEEDCELAR